MKKKNNFTQKMSTIIIVLTLFISTTVVAQTTKYVEVKIKTSAVCGDCKERIETALAFEKGVKKATLDLKTQIVTVLYNPKKTTPAKIRIAISKVGYDADDVVASEKGYSKLPGCCKKTVASH